jgi:uncharacterized membrane protein
MPADLLAVVIVVFLTGTAIFAPLVRDTPLRIGFGLVFVLFVPGYVFIAALFPEQGSGPDEAASGIDGLERVVLSFGSSIALVPLVGLLLNFSPWGLRLVPIFIALGGVTLGVTVIAAVRRRRLPPDRRFRVPRGLVRGLRTELLEPDDRTDAVLNVVLVASILLAVGSVGYAVAVPTDGESFTEFSLLTQNETGELVADDYPTNFTAGEPQSLVVGVTNREGQRTTYTVVVELQRVTVSNGSVRVREATRLHRFTPQLSDGATWRRPHQISPMTTGDRLRLQYRLYQGTPSNGLDDEPYRSLHLWVSVSNATG